MLLARFTLVARSWPSPGAPSRRPVRNDAPRNFGARPAVEHRGEERERGEQGEKERRRSLGGVLQDRELLASNTKGEAHPPCPRTRRCCPEPQPRSPPSPRRAPYALYGLRRNHCVHVTTGARGAARDARAQRRVWQRRHRRSQAVARDARGGVCVSSCKIKSPLGRRSKLAAETWPSSASALRLPGRHWDPVRATTASSTILATSS